MKRIVIAILLLSSVVFARELVCTSQEGMTLKMSAEQWDETSVSGQVRVTFVFDGHVMSQDENAGLSDSPYIVGGKIILPDNEDATPLFIQLTEDFKKAKAYLYIEGETIPYGAYDCQE